MKEIIFFPNYQEVFSNSQTGYSDVFFPIFSVKLSFINKDFGDCYIHLIQFNEDPYNSETTKYFTDYCQDRMISFTLDNSLYTFDADLKYFEVTEDWEEYYEKTKYSYLEAKNAFENGENVIDNNWYKIGGEPEWMQDDETPNDPDGNPMTFIAQFDTLFMFDDDCPKTIYLFYSEKHKFVVELYQIT